MAVTNKRIEIYPDMFIGVDLIKEVKNFKYLGTYIDFWLKYNAQMIFHKRKLSQLC